jgi:small subunit ribosomal protein S16
VSVKIRLKRMGKIRAPYYRIVVADSRTKRDGRAIEEIGQYHPTQEPSFIEVNSERAQYWLGVGAQPTEQVLVILKITGDWQRFKGEPGAEGTLRAPQQKADKKAVFEAAAKESLGDTAAEGATTPRTRKKAQPAAAAKPDANRPAPATADADQPAPATADADQLAPATPDADQPAPATAETDQPARATAETDQPAPDADQPASAAPDADQPAPAAADTDQPADAADEGAPGGSETSAQVESADETAQAEG